MTDEEKTKYNKVEFGEDTKITVITDTVILKDKDGNTIETLNLTELLGKLGYVKE